MPGRYARFSCASLMSSTIAGLRPHRTVGACALTMAATVVPHDPAPMTATEDSGLTAVAYGADVRASRRRPAPGHAMVPPMTRDVALGVGVIVPIRAFALGKARLAEHLASEDRAELARRLAECVVTAAADLPVLVVSSDDDVRRGPRHGHSRSSTTRAPSTAPPRPAGPGSPRPAPPESWSRTPISLAPPRSGA